MSKCTLCGLSFGGFGAFGICPVCSGNQNYLRRADHIAALEKRLSLGYGRTGKPLSPRFRRQIEDKLADLKNQQNETDYDNDKTRPIRSR